MYWNGYLIDLCSRSYGRKVRYFHLRKVLVDQVICNITVGRSIANIYDPR